MVKSKIEFERWFGNSNTEKVDLVAYKKRKKKEGQNMRFCSVVILPLWAWSMFCFWHAIYNHLEFQDSRQAEVRICKLPLLGWMHCHWLNQNHVEHSYWKFNWNVLFAVFNVDLNEMIVAFCWVFQSDFV